MTESPSRTLFGFDRRLFWLGMTLWILLASFGTWLAGAHEEQRALDSMRNRLEAQAQLRLSSLEQSLERYSQNLQFLVGTPPIPGLARASLNHGIDVQEQSSSELWKRRMKTIFHAYASATPEALELRLIGADGRELIRVSRAASGIVEMADAQLRDKKSEDYFIAAGKLRAGQIYVGDITLSRDPETRATRATMPVLRLSTPVYAPNGKLFAVMAASLDASHMMSYLQVNRSEHDVKLYIANQRGDFLKHPSADKAFGFERGRRWRWQDEFHSLPSPRSQQALQYLQSGEKRFYSVSHRFPLSRPPEREQRFLMVAELQPETVLDASVDAARRNTLLSMLLGGLLVAALAFVYQRQRSRMHERIRDLNASLEIQVQQRTEEIRRYASLQQAILNHASYAIIATDPDGWITLLNPAAGSLLGCAADEAVRQQRLTDWMDADELERQADKLAWENEVPHRGGFEALTLRSRHGLPNQFDWTFTRNDGQRLPVTLAMTALRGDDGKLQGFLAIAVDISERQRNQRELMRARDQLSKAAEVAELGIWSWELDSDALELNARMFDIYQFPHELRQNGLHYRQWRERLHPEDVDAVERELRNAVAGRGAYSPTFRIVLPDGQIRHIQAGALVERDNDGRPLRVTGINRDITIQHDAEAALRLAKESAEAASRAKADFLSNMSHEIRTPMNAVLGLAYLLEKAGLPASALDLVHKIRVAGRSLQGIINDILDFSKIEAGNLEIEQVPFCLGDVLDNLSTIMSANAGDRDIELVISPPPADIDHLRGDSLRLEQVLINLTSNAIKFTETGHVKVDIQPLETSSQHVVLRFAVVDTGIGIPEAKQRELFQPFTQADASTTRRFGGSGLGLAISRRLVTLMGGEIGLNSQPGEGCEFWFTLRFPREVGIRLSAPEMANLSVLIADDNPIARETLDITAGELGWEVSTTASGGEAVERVRAAQEAGRPVDVVVLDWKMPEMDGLAAAQAIRRLCRGQRMPIILMATAYSRELLKAEPAAGEINEVLNKPVTPSGLYNAVARALRPLQAAAAVQPQSNNRLDGLRLLVVDDSDINREVALRIFEDEGAVVALASDGREALDWLRQNHGDVDIVLMDVQMPVMDGYEATRAIRAAPELSHLPVVALTAGAFQTQQDAAREAGMTDYIAKPFDVDTAINLLRRLAGKKPSDAEEPVRRPPSLNPDLPGLALSRGLLIWRDADVYRQYLRKFARDYGDCVDALAQAESEAAQALTHKLKGAAGNLALEEVSARAARLEASLAAGRDPALELAALRVALCQALESIARYAPVPSPAAADAPAAASASLALLLHQAMQAFNLDNPAEVEPVLSQLGQLLPSDQLAPLRDAVENFDFRGGEAATQALAEALGLAEEW
ncbi:hypothetical protein DK842_13515 [Chromobacterium phragmitis]|uniref:response regulator n=1 Tax=Chromobacterium phragmitis TaxID=2202141 RepID=UPI000DED35BC|nr:response regulator [Chromobacterium phragmitis]AXE30817.1 hypothetical protein DK842_13515 [Chromobacterium phragmitis]